MKLHLLPALAAILSIITLPSAANEPANRTEAAGKTAADFSATDQNGRTWTLKDHLGKDYLVLYFYPAAMTGGCTKQACSYRDYIQSGGDLNVQIIGISGDSPQSLRYFQQAENLNFTLLSDPDGSIAKAFGVPVRGGEKTIARTVNGEEVSLTRSATTARQTFIIDPSGKVIYRNQKVKAVQDQSEVIKVIREHLKQSAR